MRFSTQTKAHFLELGIFIVLGLISIFSFFPKAASADAAWCGGDPFICVYCGDNICSSQEAAHQVDCPALGYPTDCYTQLTVSSCSINPPYLKINQPLTNVTWTLSGPSGGKNPGTYYYNWLTPNLGWKLWADPSTPATPSTGPISVTIKKQSSTVGTFQPQVKVTSDVYPRPASNFPNSNPLDNASPSCPALQFVACTQNSDCSSQSKKCDVTAGSPTFGTCVALAPNECYYVSNCTSDTPLCVGGNAAQGTIGKCVACVPGGPSGNVTNNNVVNNISNPNCKTANTYCATDNTCVPVPFQISCSLASPTVPGNNYPSPYQAYWRAVVESGPNGQADGGSSVADISANTNTYAYAWTSLDKSSDPTGGDFRHLFTDYTNPDPQNLLNVTANVTVSSGSQTASAQCSGSFNVLPAGACQTTADCASSPAGKSCYIKSGASFGSCQPCLVSENVGNQSNPNCALGQYCALDSSQNPACVQVPLQANCTLSSPANGSFVKSGTTGSWTAQVTSGPFGSDAGQYTFTWTSTGQSPVNKVGSVQFSYTNLTNALLAISATVEVKAGNQTTGPVACTGNFNVIPAGWCQSNSDCSGATPVCNLGSSSYGQCVACTSSNNTYCTNQNQVCSDNKPKQGVPDHTCYTPPATCPQCGPNQYCKQDSAANTAICVDYNNTNVLPTETSCSPGEICSPVASDNIVAFIGDILKKSVGIMIPIIVIFFIIDGLLFVLARGNASKLETAKRAFVFTMIGAAVLLGAWVFSQAIQHSIAVL